MQIGVANYKTNSNKEYKKRNFFKLKSGDNYYRILPPCFSLAERGEWAKFYAVHFGYHGSPNEKGVAPYRPFVCPRKIGRDKQVLIPCAEHDKIQEIQDIYNDRKKELKASGVSPEEIQAKLEPLAKYLKEHNAARRWHLNVKASDGTMGCLKIPHTAYLDLMETIRSVIEKYGVDPLAVDGGVRFNFKRTGTSFNDTKYKVEVVMEMVTTPQGRFETIKKEPLSQEDIQRMETECFDLSTMYVALTPEEVELLVSTSGDPAIVDKVFAKSTKPDEVDEAPDNDIDEPSTPVANSGGMSSEQFKTLFG